MAITNKNLLIREKKVALHANEQKKGALETLSGEVTNTNKAITSETLAVKVKKTKEELRAFDNVIVRGRFNFHEVSGGTLTFPYRKYKGDKVRHYALVDGNIYNIPRGVAKHIATTGSYPIHEYQVDENGKATVRIGRRKRRYSFESTDFLEDSEVLSANSSLYTVSKY